MDTIRFAVEYSSQYNLHSVAIYINGRSLLDYVREVELPFATQEGHPEMAGGYVGLPPEDVLFPSEHFLGQPLQRQEVTEAGKIAVMQCCCGVPGCWSLVARVDVGAEVVTWSDFEQPQRMPNWGPCHWKYEGCGTFYFGRKQYEQALLNLWKEELNRVSPILDLEGLPYLPQLEALMAAAPLIWERPEVVALWIGGSIARGNADCYSDVDLRVAVAPDALDAWRQVDLNTLFAGNCVARVLLTFGEHTLLHHLVLASGDIYDVWVQSADEAVHDEFILTLACRNEKFAAKLRAPECAPLTAPQPADGETVRRLLESFWINTHKHRKVLHRGLHLLALTGVHNERQLLMRLWHIQATNCDCGEMQTQTIHGLTHLMQTVEQIRGSEALEVIGASVASRNDIYRAIEQLRDQVTQTGRMLSQTLNFPYPDAIEQVARQGWQEYMRQQS